MLKRQTVLVSVSHFFIKHFKLILIELFDQRNLWLLDLLQYFMSQIGFDFVVTLMNDSITNSTKSYSGTPNNNSSL